MKYFDHATIFFVGFWFGFVFHMGLVQFKKTHPKFLRKRDKNV